MDREIDKMVLHTFNLGCTFLLRVGLRLDAYQRGRYWIPDRVDSLGSSGEDFRVSLPWRNTGVLLGIYCYHAVLHVQGFPTAPSNDEPELFDGPNEDQAVRPEFASSCPRS